VRCIPGSEPLFSIRGLERRPLARRTLPPDGNTDGARVGVYKSSAQNQRSLVLPITHGTRKHIDVMLMKGPLLSSANRPESEALVNFPQAFTHLALDQRSLEPGLYPGWTGLSVPVEGSLIGQAPLSGLPASIPQQAMSKDELLRASVEGA
jgi:hypothetical protein